MLSDCEIILAGNNVFTAYNNIQQLPTVQNHGTVNHSLEFVDSQTGVHTNHIESYWNRVKIKLKRIRGCRRTMVGSYLDEFLWREKYGRTSSDVLENMYRDIAIRYPV